MSCPMVDKCLQPLGCRVSGDEAGEGARVSGHGRCGNGHQPGWLSQWEIELGLRCANFLWIATAVVSRCFPDSRLARRLRRGCQHC